MEQTTLTKEEIRAITDKAHQPCLIGMRAFDKDIQQYTCRAFNGKHCECYRDYKAALDKALTKTPQ